MHRYRLSGQGSLIDLEVELLDEPHVGGHLVARMDQYHVSWYHFPGGHPSLLTFSKDHRFGGSHLLESFKCAFGPVLLEKAEDRGHEDDSHNGHGVEYLADENRDQRRGQEKQNKKVLELVEEDEPARPSLLLPQLVRPETLKPPAGVFVAQALNTGAQSLHGLVGIEGMPRR